MSKNESFIDIHKKTSTDDLAEEGYTIGRLLGEGTYSKVKIAKFGEEELAVKIINRDALPMDVKTKFLPRELDILTKIKHPNIVEIYKIFLYPRETFIFMEKIGEGDLLHILRDRGRLVEFEAHNYFKQLVNAVLYLHNMNIAHRDLKCENILINDNDEIKIIDFGFGTSPVNDEGRRILSETFCGSAAYAAPEVIQGVPYNPMMHDVWSLGCVLFIMVTGKMPFDCSNVIKMIDCQLEKRYKYPASFTIFKPIKRLISHMLEPDVTKRANMRQVNKCLWIRQRKRISRSTQTLLPCAFGMTHSSIQCCCRFDFEDSD